ncbi:MAG: type II secretion system F family protein [bacterium]
MILLLCGLTILLAGLGSYDLIRGHGAWFLSISSRLADLQVPWPDGRRRALSEVFDSLGTEHRLQRSGLGHRMETSHLMAFKGASLLIGVALCVGLISGLGGGRATIALYLALPFVFYFGPDAALEWYGRRRVRVIERLLSDALDLAANGISGGEEPLRALSGASPSDGPLGLELAALSEERRYGSTRSEALSGLRSRVPSQEVTVLAAAIERSARFGSPLGERFRQQAEDLRHDQRRLISERAARSSPRIQLVVALLLVPSVLLMIAAGLSSNLGSFTSGL